MRATDSIPFIAVSLLTSIGYAVIRFTWRGASADKPAVAKTIRSILGARGP